MSGPTPSSPMAVNPPVLQPSFFAGSKSRVKAKSSSMNLNISAADYLSAVSEADLRARSLSRDRNGAVDADNDTASSVTHSAASTIFDSSPMDSDSEYHRRPPSSSATSTFTSPSSVASICDVPTASGCAAGCLLCTPRRAPTSEQHARTAHTEFGHCFDQRFRFTTKYGAGSAYGEEEPPYYVVLATFVSFLLVICLGHVRDFVGKRLNPSAYRHLMAHDGYAPLNSDFDSFYTRRLKQRMDECFSQPTTGVAGRTVLTLDRYSPDFNRTQFLAGTQTRCLNISSYNYLGFAQSAGGCADAVEACITRYGVGAHGARLSGGSTDLHVQAERLVARFIGTEDALVSSMGFATNSTVLPALVGKGSLVISDELNHASIRFGVRLSGADVRMFKHNDMRDLEKVLRDAISQGQGRTKRPWKKILLVVEGLYSMEGDLVRLPEIMELKKKYKFYLYVDEAHSVGALGSHGRGVTDYFGIPPRSIDILMGTFTKSFGAAGGYIAGPRTVINRLRLRAHGAPYAEAMAPAVVTQVIASMASIMGVRDDVGDGVKDGAEELVSSVSELTPAMREAVVVHGWRGACPPSLLPSWIDLPLEMRDGSEGRARMRRLAFNSRYLSRALIRLGFVVYGHDDSPVVPLLIFNPGKMMVFHRMMKMRRVPIVVVVVAYPATSLTTSRVRFCVSAAHTKEDIDEVLDACDYAGEVLDLKHGRCERWTLERIKTNAVELVHSPLWK